MRFLLRKQSTAEQHTCLQTAEQVSFVSMEAVGENGGLNLDITRDKTSVEKGYTLFFDGDVIVAKITPCFENGKGALAIGLYGGIAYGTTELHVLSPLPELDKRFLFYLTMSHTFRKQGEAAMKGAAGQKRVPDEFIQDFRFSLPPLALQRRIADYLDAETAQIDALIAEKERMLALLEEKRAALVSHTVTRGLNPNIPMKPSGLDWLGDIPAHWEVKRLKHFARIGNGSTPNRDNPRYWEGGDYPWLNSSVVNSRKVEDASRYVTEEALTECHLPKISPPAVLVAITGQGKTRGKSAVLELEATINQHLAFIKPEPDAVDCLYLSLLLDTAYSFIRSDSESAGSTRGAITCEQLSNFYITLPPREEQSEILSFAKEQISTIGSVEETLRRSILLLKERRSALITAAVTGQLALEMVST
jgi:type I restriction enzyme S subunit